MISDIEIIDADGWEAQALDFKVRVYKDLTGVVTDVTDGSVFEFNRAPEFFKAIKRIERTFAERYGRE